METCFFILFFFPVWAKLQSLWIYRLFGCHCCKGPKICCSGDSSVFWRVNSLISPSYLLRFSVFAVLFSTSVFLIFSWGPDTFFPMLFHREKLNSMNLLLYMAPIACLVLLPATFVLEPNVPGVVAEIASKDPTALVLLLVNSSVAFLVNLTNFLVTKHTSALTLQVNHYFTVLWFWKFGSWVFTLYPGC